LYNELPLIVIWHNLNFSLINLLILEVAMGLASFSAIIEFAIGEKKVTADFISSVNGNSNALNSKALKKIQSKSGKNKRNLQLLLGKTLPK